MAPPPEFTGASDSDIQKYGALPSGPRIPGVSGLTPPSPTLSSLKASQVTEGSLGRVLAYGWPGAVAGLVDTLGQSVGLLDDDDVEQTLSWIDPEGFGDFFARNKEALQTVGEVAGIMLPGKIILTTLRAIRLARESGRLGSIFKNSSAADLIMGNAGALSKMEANLASRAGVNKGLFGPLGSGRTQGDPVLTAAKKSYYAARVADTARQTAAFEFAYRGLYGQSDLFFPEDATVSDEIKWAGAGLGIGIALDAAIGRFKVRQLIQNAPALFTIAEHQNLAAFSKNAASITSRPNQRGPAMAYLGRWTQLAKQADKAVANPTLSTNLRSDYAHADNVLGKAVVDAGRDPRVLLNQLQFAVGEVDKRRDLVVQAVKDDPTSMLFLNYLADVPEDGVGYYASVTKELKDAQTHLANLERSQILKGEGPRTTPEKLSIAEKRVTDAKAMQNDEYYVIESTGEITPHRLRADNWMDQNGWGLIKRERVTEKEAPLQGGVAEDVSHTKLSAEGVTLDDRWILGLPAAKETPKAMSVAYAMGAKMISEWRGPAKNQIFVLNEKVPLFQAEGIVALARANPEAAKLVHFDGAFQTLDDAEFHIINEKYKAWSKGLSQVERQPRGADLPKKAAEKLLDPAELTDMLNLPRGDGLRIQPLTEVFAQARIQGSKSLEEIFVKKGLTPQSARPMDLLKAAMREGVGITDPKVPLPLSGNLLAQKDIRPVFMASKPVPALYRSDAIIHARVEALQQQNLQRLNEIDPANAPLISLVTKSLSPGVISAAKDVLSLNDQVASGRGVVVQQDRINEQYDTLKALSSLAHNSDTTILKYVGDLMDKRLTGLTTKVLARNNEPVMVDVNRIEQSYRHGWDIDSIESLGDGSSRFVLDNEAPINQRLMREHFGTDLVPDEVNYMPDMSIAGRKAGQLPFTVSDEAADFVQEVSNLEVALGVETNALRVALGQSAIKLRKFHLPSPDIAIEGAWFVRNPMDRVIGTVSKGTEPQNRQRALDAARKLSEVHGEAHIATPYSLTREEHAMDGTFMNFIDHSDQLSKTGSGILGGLASTEVDRTPNTVKNMVSALAQQYINVGIRARASLFEPQLNYARQASKMTGKGQGFVKGENNIFDRYMALMFSRSTQSGGGQLAGAYRMVENGYDNALSYLSSVTAEASSRTAEGKDAARGLRRIVQRNSSEAEYRQYQERHGEWSPFKTTQDWLDSTHQEIPTQRLKPHAVALSKASATMSLRFLDFGTALLNFTGLLTNAPSVTMGLRQLAGEDRAKWLSRTAAWSSQLGTTTDIKTFSPMRAMVSGAKAFWDPEVGAAMSRAADLGHFKPEYKLLNDAFSKPVSKEKNVFEKFVDVSSAAADWSEEITRKYAWGMGYSIGKDLHKFEDERDLFIFAGDFVNVMIGNYSPRNKPGMYQGAVGLPLGAFMTFMFNNYRRMYGQLERKDYTSLAAMYATQASVFGTSSVPGWGLFNSTLLHNYDGSDNLNTRLDRQLPPGVGELVMHGSLSSIPAIFGQGGIALYPRGSIDITQVPPNPTDYARAVPIQFLWTTAQGIGKTIDNFMGSMGLAGKAQRQAEILANFSTNRATKTIMEFAAGAKTDRAGQIVEAATLDALHVAAGMLGTTTSETRKAIDAYNSQQVVERHQANARAKLNDGTRAVLRSGDFEVSDFRNLAEGYVRSGGNPAYFGQWLRNNIESATIPKTTRKLDELSRSGKWLEFVNLLAAMQQVTPPEKGPVP